jgi:NAD(P)-dependent dehydrogenase (short-subunit alcohol dehydrogenase family)
MMAHDLHGKRALVTGASSGLGAHFARLLARQGVEVVLAARRAETLSGIVAEIRQQGGAASAMRLDVRDIEASSRAISELGTLSILVNNAGIVREGAALDQNEAAWDDVIDTNLKGMFFVAQAAARLMAPNPGGAIINIRLDPGSAASRRGASVCGVQGWRRADDEMPRPRAGAAGHARQRPRARLPPHRVERRILDVGRGSGAGATHTAAAPGAAGGSRRTFAAARFGCLALHDRRGTRGRWRPFGQHPLKSS